MTQLFQVREAVDVRQTQAPQPEDPSSNPDLVSSRLRDLEQVSKPLGASISFFIREMFRE